MKRSLIEIEEADYGDAFIISNLLRDEDVAEIRATYPVQPITACVGQSIQVSDWAKLAYADDKLIAVFGIVKYDHGHNPWMLGTRYLEEHPTAVGRVSKVMLGKMLEDTAYLFNWVHDKHFKAIEWLTWLGFKVEDKPSVFGPTGEGFRFFYMGERDV